MDIMNHVTHNIFFFVLTIKKTLNQLGRLYIGMLYIPYIGRLYMWYASVTILT